MPIVISVVILLRAYKEYQHLTPKCQTPYTIRGRGKRKVFKQGNKYKILTVIISSTCDTANV